MSAQTRNAIRSAGISVGGILFGFAVGAVVIAAQGKPVGASLAALLEGSFGSVFAIGNTLNKAAALLLIAAGYIYARLFPPPFDGGVSFCDSMGGSIISPQASDSNGGTCGN